MRVIFTSTHVARDFADGRLLVKIASEDDRLGQTTWHDIFFDVPCDFHTHHDAVAAALMTLVGTRYQEAAFNFPISAACAEILGRFYHGVEIGPVDPSLEPRLPGTRLALNFSGGLDSTAAWVILNEALGGDFAVVTSEYGGHFIFEAQNYERYRRDVSCRTDLRRQRFDRSGRFNFCVPLLFADYLGLGSLTTGHSNLLSARDLEALPGERPEFLFDDLAVNAGGLQEIHLLRGLHTRAVLTILVTLDAERAEAALSASHPLGTAKHYTRARMLRDIHLDLGFPLPAYLQKLPPRPTDVTRFGIDPSLDLRTLAFVKREGRASARRIWPWVTRLDLSFLDDMAFTFPMRYNTTFSALMPEPLRSSVVAIFRRCDIESYDERDWQELATVREFLRANGARYLRRSA